MTKHKVRMTITVIYFKNYNGREANFCTQRHTTRKQCTIKNHKPEKNVAYEDGTDRVF